MLMYSITNANELIMARETNHRLYRRMYVTGGKNQANRAVGTVSCFDPKTKDITMATELNIARFGHGLVEINDQIYAFGGYGDDGARMKHVERYDEISKVLFHFFRMDCNRLE